MRFTQATTKREAVVKVLEEFDRRRRMAELVKHTGTSATDFRPTTRSRRSTPRAIGICVPVLVDSSLWVHQLRKAGDRAQRHEALLPSYEVSPEV